jgi:hypothetical protein
MNHGPGRHKMVQIRYDAQERRDSRLVPCPCPVDVRHDIPVHQSQAWNRNFSSRKVTGLSDAQKKEQPDSFLTQEPVRIHDAEFADNPATVL